MPFADDTTRSDTEVHFPILATDRAMASDTIIQVRHHPGSCKCLEKMAYYQGTDGRSFCTA
jgi:hypothetical protein